MNFEVGRWEGGKVEGGGGPLEVFSFLRAHLADSVQWAEG